MYGLTITRTGSDDPVTLTEIKAHVRQDLDVDDTVLADLVSAAAQKYEEDTGKVLRQSTVALTLDSWPRHGVIQIPRAPISSVTSITYLEDGQSSPTTLSDTLYRFDGSRQIPRVVLKKDEQWPTATLEHGSPITVTCVGGYADGSVPERDKHALKLLVGHWYANRETAVVGAITASVPEAYRALALGDRTW
jgi:uncharacterized phiE125 gp8 family phage protein